MNPQEEDETELNDGRLSADLELRKTEEMLASLGWPPDLIKANSDDPFDYALQLRTGTIIRFTGASPYGQKWVLLSGVDAIEQPPGFSLPYPVPRGLSVRLSDIVWVADAPEGS